MSEHTAARDAVRKPSQRFIKIVIAGPIATGKNEVCEHLLPKKFMDYFQIPIRYVSVSDDIAAPLAEERQAAFDISGKVVITDIEMDMEIDRRTLALLETDENLIVTSRTIPALLSTPAFYRFKNPGDVIRILYSIDPNEQVRRVIKRDLKREPTAEEVSKLFAETKRRIDAREERDFDRFGHPDLYGKYGIVNVYDDKYYHDVIDTTGMTIEAQVDATFEHIMHHLK